MWYRKSNGIAKQLRDLRMYIYPTGVQGDKAARRRKKCHPCNSPSRYDDMASLYWIHRSIGTPALSALYIGSRSTRGTRAPLPLPPATFPGPASAAPTEDDFFVTPAVNCEDAAEEGRPRVVEVDVWPFVRYCDAFGSISLYELGAQSPK